MRIKAVCILTALLAAGLSCCSSDPEGPVTAVFIEEGSYSPKAGETVRYIDTLRSVLVVRVPTGIGKASLLKLGEVQGLRFESILMQFDFDSLADYDGKTVDSVLLDLPVRLVQDTLFHLKVTFNELLEGFDEDDTLTVAPPFSPIPIEGPAGQTVRDINIERTVFPLDNSIVQDWLDGTTSPWQHGIIIRWAGEPDTLGLIELNSHNFGSDPIKLRVQFSDDSEAIFPVAEDYNIVSFTGGGLSCVGGVATRLYFRFDLPGLDKNAMVHYSALVLHSIGADGLGATPAEANTTILGLPTDFIYYLYTPNSPDTLLEGFYEGTGVARDQFIPTADTKLRIPLRGYTRDVLAGLRENTGLVFQSDQETVRFQRATFYGMSAGDSLRPYIEVIYSLPADFSGE